MIYTSPNRIVLSIFGKQISIKKRTFLIDYFRFKFIANWYKIVPLGTYCLPRVISTLARLKPRKRHGEPTFPFDLAFFNDLNAVADLIQNKFFNFYDGLERNTDGLFVNKHLQAVFNHDSHLTKDQFIKRYNTRINKFYECLSNKDKKIFFLIASSGNDITEYTIQKLLNAIETHRKDNYELIIIDRNKNNRINSRPKVHIINTDNDEFDIINKNHDWIKEISHLKSNESRKFYEHIQNSLTNIIKRSSIRKN